MVFLSIMLLPDPSVFALDDVSELRCSGGIISTGDSKMEVETKCGSPTDRAEGGEVWIYNLGSTRFVYYLTFADGRLERIQSGPFGK